MNQPNSEWTKSDQSQNEPKVTQDLPKLIELTNIVRTLLTKVVQSWPKLIEPSQTKLTKMKQSNPKLVKINEIDQDS